MKCLKCKTFWSLVLAGVLVLTPAIAATEEPDEEAKHDEVPDFEEEEPKKLETIQTEAEPIEMDEELALRLIHMGLQEPRRLTAEYMDRVVCRHREVTGSRLRYVICGTNAAWMAGEPDMRQQSSTGQSAGNGGEGSGQRESAGPRPSDWGQDSGAWGTLAQMAGGGGLDMDLEGGFAVLGPISRRQIEQAMLQVRALQHSERIVARMLDPQVSVPPEVRDGTIHELAEIHVALDDVRLEWVDEIEATTGREQQRLVEKMDKELESVLADHGYSVEEYNEQVAHIEEDEDLLNHKAGAVEDILENR